MQPLNIGGLQALLQSEGHVKGIDQGDYVQVESKRFSGGKDSDRSLFCIIPILKRGYFITQLIVSPTTLWLQKPALREYEWRAVPLRTVSLSITFELFHLLHGISIPRALQLSSEFITCRIEISFKFWFDTYFYLKAFFFFFFLPKSIFPDFEFSFLHSSVGELVKCKPKCKQTP